MKNWIKIWNQSRLINPTFTFSNPMKKATGLNLGILCIFLGVFLGSFLGGCDPQPPPSSSDPSMRPIDDLYVLPQRPEQEEDAGLFGDMGIEEEGPILNSILPNRSPLEGGLTLRIIGARFQYPMLVDIGGQPCDELVIENANRMLCTLPARMEPETVSVSIAWETGGAQRVLEDALEYYQALELSSVSPQQGPTQGNTEVILTGKGFVDPTEVRFGQELVLVSQVISDTEIRVLSPPGPSSLVDVSVRNPNGSATLEDQFRWLAPLNLNQVEPAWGWLEGGQEVRLYGYGLLEESVVQFGEQTATVIESQAPQRIVVQSPPQSQAGWAPLQIENGNGQKRKEKGFLYLDPEVGEFDVLGVHPQRLSDQEGGYLLIGGNGFDESVNVSLDGNPLTCSVDTPQTLRCFSPAYPRGTYSLTIEQQTQQEQLDLEYYSVVDVYSLSPARGSIMGGGLIQLQGRGFTPSLQAKFNDRSVILDRFISSEEVFIKIPPHPAGLVDFTLTQEDQEIYIPDAFEYFDPLSAYGGSWGEYIEHSLNVVTLSIYDFMPVDDVQIEVRPFNDPTQDPFITGITNEMGQTVISQENLPAPLHVTAHKVGWEVQTFERVVSENLIALMLPFTPPEPGEGDPPPPVEPVSIRGNVVGLAQLEKPVDSDVLLIVFVNPTHSDQLGRNRIVPNSTTTTLFEDGPFSFMASPGQMAVIATAAYVPRNVYQQYQNRSLSYWAMRQKTYPIAMGMARHLSLSPGSEIQDLTINLDIPLNTPAELRLLNPSVALDEQINDLDQSILEQSHPPTDPAPALSRRDPIYEIRCFLDLGADGYWELDPLMGSDDAQMIHRSMPSVDQLSSEINIEWMGRVRVLPYTPTSTLYHRQRDLSRPVELGPVVAAPRLVSPNLEEVLSFGDTIQWDYWPGLDRPLAEPPQAIWVRLLQNGLPMWSMVLPGGVQELTLPYLPIEHTLGPFSGEVTVQIQTFSTLDGFDYQDYSYLDLYYPENSSTLRFKLGYRNLLGQENDEEVSED